MMTIGPVLERFVFSWVICEKGCATRDTWKGLVKRLEELEGFRAAARNGVYECPWEHKDVFLV
jgi:hypothetical protein